MFAGEHLPVPADLGVAVGDLRDDPGGHPRLPRRHGEVGGGETRREGQAVPEEAGARHVPGDVRDHQRGVLRLRRVVLGSSRHSGLATSVACPWPYPEAKVYDPQGYYEENGAEGRTRSASGPPGSSALPDGRPDVELGAQSAIGVHPRTRMAEPRSCRHHRCVPRARVRIGDAPVQAGVARRRGHAIGRRWHGQAARGDRGGRRRSAADRRSRSTSPTPASVAAAAKTIEEAIGAPYALVHNAGIAAAGMVEETPMSLWEKMFATHVFGPVALTKALLPSMREAGRGRIVLVSSAGGVRGMPTTAPYSAAKGAAGTVGRIDGGRDRAVRSRRHHPGHRYLRHRHHHRRGHHR